MRCWSRRPGYDVAVGRAAVAADTPCCTRLRLADAQQQAHEERGVAQAVQQALQQRVSSTHAALLLHQQEQQGCVSRQLRAMGDALGGLDSLQDRVQRFEHFAGCMASLHDQQQAAPQQQLLLAKLSEWADSAAQLAAAGAGISASVDHLQQQWAVKQQRLRTGDKAAQVRSVGVGTAHVVWGGLCTVSAPGMCCLLLLACLLPGAAGAGGAAGAAAADCCRPAMQAAAPACSGAGRQGRRLCQDAAAGVLCGLAL